MQFTVLPEITIVSMPEVVSKTDKSITLRVTKPKDEMKKDVKYQIAYSEHGYVYYSWTESELFPTTLCPIKGLTPNTTYVFKARIVDDHASPSIHCGEWSELTSYVRTFTEEEDAKRSGTVFEHALKLERAQKSKLQSHISNLTTLLDATSREKLAPNAGKIHEDMMSSRRIIDTTIQKLQSELMTQDAALRAIRQQRLADEQMIMELLNEQETLRTAQMKEKKNAQKIQADMSSASSHAQEVAALRAQLEANEALLQSHQQQVELSQAQIVAQEEKLKHTQLEIDAREAEVEKLMADCNRVVQEQTDLMAVKQLEVEEALLEAKNSLEQQLDINTYLREEVSRLREENHHLKNQMQEMDSEIVPKLVQLEDENEELKRQLAARR